MTEKELEKIYNEAYKAVYWTAMQFLKNEADVEDVVQDTFISFMESYGNMEDTTKAVALLKKIAANKCLDRIKLSRTDVAEDEFLDSVEAVPEDFLPDSIIESEDARRIVMDIINNSLSDDIRRTLILFYFDEMSTKEIAEALGVPEGTVRRRLNFARNKIKKEVENYEKENDTKLFSMALPFLSKLFMKEAELVPFKAMPAKLISLSASAEASKAGTNIAKMAVKKGTDIMKTKILIGSVAAVVAVGATVGIILGVVNKKTEETPVISDTTSISEENETTEMIIVSSTEAISEKTTTASSVTGDRWIDNSYLCICGQKFKVGLTDGCTVQDIAETGCYLVIWSYASGDYGYYTLDDEYDIEGMRVVVFPDEASAAAGTGGLSLRIGGPETPNILIKDCTVQGFDCTPQDAAVWGDDLVFDFPMDMTPEQLVENSGDSYVTYSLNLLPIMTIQEGGGVTGEFEEYSYMSSDLSRWFFIFDENNQLVLVTMITF
ncbi:MAG: sigma-70 family RNA polymerase sigma factor [Clostridia bacterium]|nr:sigma-70 family RNA polymerase sigma factor [Clostridia bacterium]